MITNNINSKQWKEFKEWRKSERKRIINSPAYIELTVRIQKAKDREACEKAGKKAKWWDDFMKFPPDIEPALGMNADIAILTNKRYVLFYDIPSENLEACYMWLLENNKII